MRSLLLAVFAFQSVSAYACSCVAITVDQARSDAEVVFRGTITDLRDADHPPAIGPLLVRDTKKVAVFSVSRVWKGQVGPIFEMPAVEETSACTGFVPSLLKIGNDLLVYAKRFPGTSEYYTNICTRTGFAKVAKDLDELGPGTEPTTTEPDSNDVSNLPDGSTLWHRYIDVTKDYAPSLTLKLVDTVSIKLPPLLGTFLSYQDISGKLRLSIDLPPIGKSENGSDGTVAWSRSPSGKPQIVPKQAVRPMMLGVGPGDLAGLNTRFTVETIGRDTVDGKPCYLIRMIPKSNETPVTACLDEASGLMVKIIKMLHTPAGDTLSTQLWRDFREVDGMLLPHEVELTSSGLPMVISFTEIGRNGDLPSGVFDLPDDVRALVENEQRKKVGK
jgi:hypothetical protein